jgi:hypothetical protein
MAQRFVEQLKAAGHSIVGATITHGGRDDLTVPVQDYYRSDEFEKKAETVEPASG